MSDTAPSTSPTPTRGQPWWIPAATFVVGLLLGGSVIAATMSGDGTDTAASAASPSPSTSLSPSSVGPGSPSPTGAGDVTVTVPDQCLQLAQDSQQVLDLVNQAAAAARDLDAAKLADLVRQMQSRQDELSSQTSACRDAAQS